MESSRCAAKRETGLTEAVCTCLYSMTWRNPTEGKRIVGEATGLDLRLSLDIDSLLLYTIPSFQCIVKDAE